MKTWDDVLAAARGKAWTDEPTRLDVTGNLFHHAVTAVEMGRATREEAMITLALTLVEMVQIKHDMIVHLLNTQTIPPIVIPKAPPAPPEDQL